MSVNLKLRTENKEENDSSEMTQEECELYDLFINEYNDLFENVLNIKGQNLYSMIKHNVSLLIGKKNFSKYSKSSLKKVHNKLKEEYFEPDNIVIEYLEENLDSINIKELPILNIDTIFAHCNRCYKTSHICGKPLYNYKYYDLIICFKCKMIYKKNMIRLFCDSCNEEYFSYIVNESNYKDDFFPATWEKYHCFSFNYEQMTCPGCSSPLYYSEIKNLLKCFKCKWTSNPKKVLWECEVCGKKFNSKVKEFVKYETKPEINCVKYALINRINARPYQCKCCKENPISLNFFHPGCGGGYYLSYLQKKYAVVCDKCKIIQKPEELKWGCGKCRKNFMCDKMVVSESVIEKEKNLRRSLGIGGYTRNEFFLEKNEKRYKKITADNKDKFMTSKKNDRIENDRIKKISSQKIEFKPKTKTILERNKDNLNLSLRNNLVKDLQTLNVNENIYKNRLEKISQKFRVSNSENTSFDFYSLKKNRSENIINFKSYNRKKLDLNSNKSNEKIYNNNNTEKEKNKIYSIQLKTEKKPDKESEKKIQEKDNILETNKKIRKFKNESSIIIKNKELETIKERNLKKVKTDKANNYPRSAIAKVKEYSENKDKIRNNYNYTNKNQYVKYNRLKTNSILERPNLKGQSQKKAKNIRLNFSVNININNILDNNKYKNNTIYPIKPEKPLEPQEDFNPEEFKLVEKIGFGSFGKIYKARWAQNTENYAMKIINLKYAEDINDTQKKLKIIRDFYKETNSPGIIKTYGYLYKKIGKEEYKFYILMELAQTDWEQEIKSRNKKHLYYTRSELFDIIKQLVSCYALLQKKNISHRDVKPQNVLILNGQYKLCDFGEARNISGKNGYIHQPIRGSELYMSPILFDALNNNKIDVLHNSYKSDVFSLGMCIFLAATLSFDCLYDIREEKNMKKIKKILEKYLLPRYSSNLVNILFYMLQVDEDLRPNFIQLEKIIFK